LALADVIFAGVAAGKNHQEVAKDLLPLLDGVVGTFVPIRSVHRFELPHPNVLSCAQQLRRLDSARLVGAAEHANPEDTHRR
jgi:hypothetical protein